MECPKCGSQDTHPGSVAHRQRITKSETATTGTRASGHDAAHHELGSVTKTQAQLSKDAPPPANAFGGARWILIVLIVAYFTIKLLARVAGIDSLGPFGPIMVILILGTAVWFFISYPQRSEYREALAEREKSWACGRCGNNFVP